MKKINQTREELWKKFAPVSQAIKKYGAPEYFEKNFGDWRGGFFSAYDRVVCMDEGTAILRGADDANGDLCIAGSGILYPAVDESDRLTKLTDIFISSGIKIITAHDDCGAVRTELTTISGIDPTPEAVNQRAREWTESVVARMIQNGADCVSDYIPGAEMSRPEGQHQAIAIYYDAVGRFNPARLGMVPPGFVINRAVFGSDYALTEVKLAIGIALGHHGFGDYFTPDYPLIIIPVTTTALAPEVNEELAKAVAETLAGERIIISALIAD